VEKLIFVEHTENYAGPTTPGRGSLPFGHVHCHHCTISFGHATFDQALLPRFDFDDLSADFVIFGAISHEYVRHIVGYFPSQGMTIFYSYGFTGPFQDIVIGITEMHECHLPPRSIPRLSFAHILVRVLGFVDSLRELAHGNTLRAA